MTDKSYNKTSNNKAAIALHYDGQSAPKIVAKGHGELADEIIALLKEGIEKVNSNVPTKVIANENEALEYIYANPVPGALYTIMCDVVAGAGANACRQGRQPRAIELGTIDWREALGGKGCLDHQLR